jgi:cleavage and polyadenylation specificity factor subunit 1
MYMTRHQDQNQNRSRNRNQIKCQNRNHLQIFQFRNPAKTAIITPFGLFEYLFTLFGLSNAAQTFQRMMDRTTDGLEGVFAYMDNSRIGSPDRQTHLRHLVAFFTAIAINLEKCVFATPSLEILGHRISATGAAPTADHAAEI